MGKPEEWFWESELRIVWNLIFEKKEIERAKQKSLAVYIACYVWGKNPDEETENEPIMGRDIPISDSALRGLYG